MAKYSFLYFILISINQLAFSQKLPQLKPEIRGYPNEYTKGEQVMWDRAIGLLRGINSGDVIYDSLKLEDKELVDSLEMGFGPFTEGGGCSWYCGGGPYKMSSSSFLNDQGKVNYNPNNLHDFNLLSAWVPETKTGIIGQKFNFHFKPFSPRVHTIRIWNGYLKTIEHWKQNSRAKKLKLYIDQKPYAVLDLADVTNVQSFKIDPVQSTDTLKDMILTFEILEIYPGTKYKDMAISEINFQGLDVHCFSADTKIFMNGGEEKRIDQIIKGDEVISFNEITGEYFSDEVDSVIIVRHTKLTHLYFDGAEIKVTNDHPFLVDGKGWSAIHPHKANQNYYQENEIQELKTGDLVFYFKGKEQQKMRLMNVSTIEKNQYTYTILLKRGNSFIVNGLVVKTEIEKILK